MVGRFPLSQEMAFLTIFIGVPQSDKLETRPTSLMIGSKGRWSMIGCQIPSLFVEEQLYLNKEQLEENDRMSLTAWSLTTHLIWDRGRGETVK